jgi:ABC-2 type transport system permease protein
MRSLTLDLLAGFRNPEFWAFSSWLDIVVRSRQSRLGIFWLVSPVIVYVWGVGFFFANMMGRPLVVHAAYVALGYVIFRCVSTIVMEATGAFATAGAFILDGHVRLTDFVLRVVTTSLFHLLLSLPVVGIALLMSPETKWLSALAALAVFPLVVLNGMWVAVVFALIGARFLDIRHLISNVFMFVFLLTPIVWHAEMMPADSLRGSLMRFNPFYHLIEAVRAPILGAPIDPTTWPYLGVMTVVGWALALVAYRRYARFVPLWV